MTALQHDTPRDYEIGDLNQLPVAANVLIYEGAAVSVDNLGYAKPLSGGEKFVGFAKQQANNQHGLAGEVMVTLETKGKIKIEVENSMPADIGKTVFANADNKFSLNSDNSSPIGIVYRVESPLSCMVAFSAY